MRETILLDALEWLKKNYTLILNSEKYMNLGIEKIEKALTDWASAPKEARYGNDILEFLRPLIYYSQIHTVTGVQPVDMVMHEEAWRKAQQWVNENYDIVESEGGRHRVPKESPSSAPESEQNENMTWVKEKIERMITMYDKGGLAQLKKVIELINMSPSSAPESGGEDEDNYKHFANALYMELPVSISSREVKAIVERLKTKFTTTVKENGLKGE